MAVNTEVTTVEYAGTGTDGASYSLPFKFLTTDHIDVYVNDIVYLSDLSIIGAGEESGGYILVDDAIPVTSTVRIERNTPPLQVYEYEEGDRLIADVVEENHDHTVMALQTLKRAFNALEARLNEAITSLDALTTSAILDESGTPILDEAGLSILSES